MSIIGQGQIIWSGVGGPGVSTFHFNGLIGDGETPQLLTDALQGFADALSGLLPNEYQLFGSDEFLILDDTDGALQAARPVVPWTSTGQATGVYSRAAGAVINWNTGAVVGRRRLRGRTFWVPLVGSAFDANGVLLPSTISTIQNAAANLIEASADTGAPLGVWSPTHGVTHTATSVSVPTVGAILRSRRD